MGTITGGLHYHECPACSTVWPHKGYGCGGPALVPCERHADQTAEAVEKAPQKTTEAAERAAKEAVADMAQKMRDLHDPTTHVVLRAVLVALVLVGLRWGVTAAQEPTETHPVAACRVQRSLPDPVCTPGATDPRVTQENIRETICLAGYSGRMRPPVRITNSWKLDRMAAYGVTGAPRLYELDHLVSIELGGDPGAQWEPASGAWVDTNWQANLWPQIRQRPDQLDAAAKDTLERVLHTEICAGRLPLAQAQAEIASDWVQAYRTYVEPNQ